jgi:GMP synthase (glutamine-hydrolysing)
MEKILIADFGSQYTQLIGRRIRELNVYCEIFPFHHLPAYSTEVKGLILSGSPFSVHDQDHPSPDLSGWIGKVPVLAICYGAQFLASHGGEVVKSVIREYGRARLNIKRHQEVLFAGWEDQEQVWMSHGDSITTLPREYESIAESNHIPIAAFRSTNGNNAQPVYGIQFHPEVSHTHSGKKLLENFCFKICHCSGDWTAAGFIESTVSSIRKQVGNEQVLLALSGGVDSTVAAMLLKKAIGNNLHCIFLDNGLLRKNEYSDVMKNYEAMELPVTGFDAAPIFLNNLKHITDPEQKRKIIGRTFIEVFESQSHSLQNIKWLGQGTIYPDVIESVSVHGPSATIKSHHNVGGLPDRMHLKVIEPLRLLFKDEVRSVGKELSIPEQILNRHPFPGPGLSIRILGEVTREKVDLLQKADAIFIEALRETGWYEKIWQAAAILLPVHTVGVMGDERTYENVVALRAVESVDGMTADWSHLPYELLAAVSGKIINQIKGINRVVYDISSKPPATIEWE